jgi:hypothetical protein
VPDAVDRVDRVAHRDGVGSAPLAGGEDSGVDLQVHVPVWVAGAGAVVPHRHCLQSLDGCRDLRAAGTHARRRVLAQPLNDLIRRLVLRRLVRGRHVRMQLRGERPGLRPVHDHFDEPHRARVGAQPTTRLPAVRIETSDPRLVAVTRQGGEFDDATVRAGGEPTRHPGVFGQVIVIRAGPIGVEVVAGSRRCAPVDLDPAVHFSNDF